LSGFGKVSEYSILINDLFLHLLILTIMPKLNQTIHSAFYATFVLLIFSRCF